MACGVKLNLFYLNNVRDLMSIIHDSLKLEM